MKMIIEVLTAASIAAGGIIWLTTIDSRTKVVASDIKKIDEIREDVVELKERASAIEAKQDITLEYLMEMRK